jgi:hypothetical protein
MFTPWILKEDDEIPVRPSPYWGMSLQELSERWVDKPRQQAARAWDNTLYLVQAKAGQSEGLAELFHDPQLLVSFCDSPMSPHGLGYCWYRHPPSSGGFHTALVLSWRSLHKGHWTTFAALWGLYLQVRLQRQYLDRPECVRQEWPGDMLTRRDLEEADLFDQEEDKRLDALDCSEEDTLGLVEVDDALVQLLAKTPFPSPLWGKRTRAKK